jgi:hypothetical protein
MHGLAASARLTIPANGLLVFARDFGDESSVQSG